MRALSVIGSSTPVRAWSVGAQPSGPHQPNAKHSSTPKPTTSSPRVNRLPNPLPKSVLRLTNLGCWVVGGAAKPATSSPRDWDLLCPFEFWELVAPLVPPQAVPNSFGGWKFTDEVEIDLWPDDLSRWLARPGWSGWVWHPKTNTRMQPYKAVSGEVFQRAPIGAEFIDSQGHWARTTPTYTQYRQASQEELQMWRSLRG